MEDVDSEEAQGCKYGFRSAGLNVRGTRSRCCSTSEMKAVGVGRGVTRTRAGHGKKTSQS